MVRNREVFVGEGGGRNALTERRARTQAGGAQAADVPMNLTESIARKSSAVTS